MRWLLWGCLLVGLCMGSCLTPSQDRTSREQEVGQRREVSAQLAVQVKDGLAVIRQFEAGKLSLWQSAPNIEVQLTHKTSAAQSWDITVDNTMVAAVLEVKTKQGLVLPVETLPSERPTMKRFRVRLPKDSEATLAIGPTSWKQREPFRFAVMSDIQDGLDKANEMFAAVSQVKELEFLVGIGDLTNNGSPAQYKTLKAQMAKALKIPYYATLGNHELGTNPLQWYSEFGRGNFSFVYKGVRFSLVDSGSGELDANVYPRLKQWLDQSKKDVHIFCTHIPLLDPIGVRNGAFASRNEALKLLTELAAGGVDLTLYGHIHSYYKFENAGIPAYISGGGGAFQERFDNVGRHFLIVDVDPNKGIRSVKVNEVPE